MDFWSWVILVDLILLALMPVYFAASLLNQYLDKKVDLLNRRLERLRGARKRASSRSIRATYGPGYGLLAWDEEWEWQTLTPDSSARV